MAQPEPASSDQRLSQINDELSNILEEKIEFLTRTLSETQRFTQKIANTELEIQRNSAQHSRLQGQCDSLSDEVGTLIERVQSATSDRDAKQSEKFEKEKEIQRLEFEIADNQKACGESQERIKGLEGELDVLDKENSKLTSRITVLEEGVLRMKEVRKEYISKIAGLDKEMKNLGALED